MCSNPSNIVRASPVCARPCGILGRVLPWLREDPYSSKESIMPNDPGLSADTCIFMEAVSGDGGVHNGNGTWWLSPDVSLTGPTSGPDKADPGQHNAIQITSHRKAAGSDCVFPFSESLSVEVW